MRREHRLADSPLRMLYARNFMHNICLSISAKFAMDPHSTGLPQRYRSRYVFSLQRGLLLSVRSLRFGRRHWDDVHLLRLWR